MNIKNRKYSFLPITIRICTFKILAFSVNLLMACQVIFGCIAITGYRLMGSWNQTVSGPAASLEAWASLAEHCPLTPDRPPME